MKICLIILLFTIVSSSDTFAIPIDSLQQKVDLMLQEKPSSLDENQVRQILELASSFVKNNPQQAIKYASLAKEYAYDLDDQVLTSIDALTILSSAYTNLNKLDSAEHVLNKGILMHVKKWVNTASSKQYLNKAGSLYQYLGLVKTNKSDFLEASRYLDTAARYFDKGGHLQNQLAAKYNQANLLTRLENFQLAEKAYQEILEISDNPRVKAAVYTSLAISAGKQNNLEKSLRFNNKSLKLAKYLDEPELTHMNMGITYRKMGDYKKAIQYLNQAEKISRQHHRTRSLPMIYNNLAKVLTLNNELKAALLYLDKSNNLITSENTGEIMNIQDKYIEIYKRQGKWKLAYESLLKKDMYQDSIESINKHNAITEIQTKYESEKKEKENLLLKKDTEFQKVIIKQQRTTLWASILGLGLLSVISILLYYQGQERKRLNKRLLNQNHELEEKNNRIDILHKELAHRVKNNLYFISSLLQLQGQSLEDETARQALKEGEARLEAMSILHRRLGIESTEENINIGEYLGELLGYLKQSYFDKSSTFPSLKVQFEDLYLDAQSAMRLGIIINELVTNSLKYAFEDIRDPMISTKLTHNKQGNYTLEYRDNGKGLSENFDFSKSNSMGMKLVSLLTKQLKGRMKIIHKKGTCIQLELPIQVL